MDSLAKLLNGLIIFAAIGFIASGLSPHPVISAIIVVIAISAPLLSHWIATKLYFPDDVDEQPARFSHARMRRPDDAKREAIGFQYFKSTFLFAGHISAADGEVCANEYQLLDQLFDRLRLDKSQITAATDYFNQGRSPHFDSQAAMQEFSQVCGDITGLCDSFLETQFSFIEASGKVVMAELHIIEKLSNRLNCHERFNHLLEEHRQTAYFHAEQQAQASLDEKKRARDKKRFEAEQARLDKKLSANERKIQLALAVLDLPKQASISDIKRAYRRQIKLHHPDQLLANGYPESLLNEATARSAKINQAYKVLKKHYGFR